MTTHERKLAVLLHADVVGSTKLVQQNESTAHVRITDAFTRFSAIIRSYGGIVHEVRGDALVAELQRASDAVTAAIAFQVENTRNGQQFDDAIVPAVRIGISLGEVVIADDTITGPGIVLAQRVEQLATPGGVFVTPAIHEATPDRLPFTYKDLGEQSAKGFDNPVRVYSVELKQGERVPEPAPSSRRKMTLRRPWVALTVAVVLTVCATAAWLQLWKPASDTAGPDKRVFALSDKPSIAVLPFDNMSGDPGQEYFSDGLTEDLITDISQISGLFVVARQSTFAYKGAGKDIRQIGAELGVRYVLEGSVRRSADRVRVNAQLIDARTGAHVWAQRLDRSLVDVFSLQDEVVEEIVAALSVRLTDRESKNLRSAQVADPQAYDLLLRGNGRLQLYTSEGNLAARALYRQAISRAPDYARAHANLAYTYAIEALFGWGTDRDTSLRYAFAIAEEALALDPDIPQAHFTLANAYVSRDELEPALDSAARSVELVPNYADGMAMQGVVLTYMGDLDAALDRIENSMLLNPGNSFTYIWFRGRILHLMGRTEEAITALEESVERNPVFDQSRIALAAAYGTAGRLDDAKWQAEELLSIRPKFSLRVARKELPFKQALHRDLYLEGLRAAGIPD